MAKIAVDLDGVCCNFIDGFLRYMNVRLNLYPKITHNHITTWNWWELNLGFTEYEWNVCFQEFTENRMWQSLDIFDDVMPSLCSLSEEGHEIYYLTDRPRKARRSTLKFLLHNGLPVDGIIFTKKKIPIAKSLGITIAIDDKTETVEEYYDAGIIAVLRNHLYNTNTNRYNMKVNNMREFHEYILVLGEENGRSNQGTEQL